MDGLITASTAVSSGAWRAHSRSGAAQRGGALMTLTDIAADPKIRVVLADDHAVLRAGLKALLNAEPDIACTLMELATSALFGLPSHTSVKGAIETLGLDVVQSLALCAHVMTRLKASRA